MHPARTYPRNVNASPSSMCLTLHPSLPLAGVTKKPVYASIPRDLAYHYFQRNNQQVIEAL
jgi:hypothetical protein